MKKNAHTNKQTNENELKLNQIVLWFLLRCNKHMNKWISFVYSLFQTCTIESRFCLKWPNNIKSLIAVLNMFAHREWCNSTTKEKINNSHIHGYGFRWMGIDIYFVIGDLKIHSIQVQRIF